MRTGARLDIGPCDDMSIEVTYRGPVFDGRAETAAHAWADETHRAIAHEGADMVGLQLIRVLRHPTGYYESHIGVESAGSMRSRVHDDRVVYGPWLEGVGSRNFPVTRFRGYFTFRKVTPLLQRRAASIAKRVLRPYLARMRG